MDRWTQATLIIKAFEGMPLVPYMDPRGIWTYGCGATIDPNGQHVGPDSAPLTPKQAEWLLTRDLEFVSTIIAHHVSIPLTANEWAALASFVFNVGQGRTGGKDGFAVLRNGRPSTMLEKINRGDILGAADEFPKWNLCDGRPLAGLNRRRGIERDIWLGTQIVRLDGKIVPATPEGAALGDPELPVVE
jgi:lysozyme